MDLISSDSEINELLEGIIYLPEHLNFIEDFQDLNEVYDRICDVNSAIITQISNVLQSRETRYERNRCEAFNSKYVSIMHCYEECQSTEDCYSEIQEDISEYYLRYLDSTIIAELVLEAFIDKNLTGFITDYETPFAEALIEIYSNIDMQKITINKPTKLVFNFPQKMIFPQLSINDSCLFDFGSSEFVVIADKRGE